MPLARRGAAAVGLKPVETGFRDAALSDAARLTAASSFHVKHTGARFEDPVSPHVASREAGAPIRLTALAAEVQAIRPQADVTVVELAGGLFTPLTEAELNADFARQLRADQLVLVAPDRLGVLHDLIAATRAADAMGLPIDGILLVAPEHGDTSTGRNAAEVPRLLRVPLLGSLPRAPSSALADHPEMQRIADRALG